MSGFEKWVEPVRETALELGLRPRETEFVEVSDETMQHKLAYYALPDLYSHWSFGRDWYRLRQRSRLGLEHVYEVVTNTHPAVAYLQRQNSTEETVLVLAHVMGHTDFADRNRLMRGVRSDLLTFLKAVRERFESYRDRYGDGAVDGLIDLAHALREQSFPEARLPEEPERPKPPREGEFGDLLGLEWDRKTAEARWREARRLAELGVPCPDPLLWLAEKAPNLDSWQRDVLRSIREVWLAILPIIQTKTMNEGWATYWQIQILHRMEEKGLLRDVSAWGQALTHSLITASSRISLNPYWLGWRLWEYLAENGDDIFLVAELEDDLGFVRNRVDRTFVERERLYTWKAEEGPADPITGQYDLIYVVESRAWERVRDELVRLHERNVRFPRVTVSDATQDSVELTADGPLEREDAARILSMMLTGGFKAVVGWREGDKWMVLYPDGKVRTEERPVGVLNTVK